IHHRDELPYALEWGDGLRVTPDSMLAWVTDGWFGRTGSTTNDSTTNGSTATLATRRTGSTKAAVTRGLNEIRRRGQGWKARSGCGRVAPGDGTGRGAVVGEDPLRWPAAGPGWRSDTGRAATPGRERRAGGVAAAEPARVGRACGVGGVRAARGAGRRRQGF